ncbi:MAG: hypothetical protein AUG49_10095 [Catenulispora sp. 13_1_20CM_3_70_7]|jgi:hypothetical protein|nr:hypothetical protein [Catenulisporales bacterium]OLE25701.1 MAG: hypothetical protein AUG49_10095 [Catenulispora sp. 13_1_20CM_3_70_7]
MTLRSRAILTVAAAAAATLGGGLLQAGTAAAATAQVPTPAPPGAPPSASGADDVLDVANNWCVAPVRLSGPLSENVVPAPYRACDNNKVGGDGGVHALDNLCVAPLGIDGPLGQGPMPYAACNDEVASGPGPLGPISVLRNASVLGVQLTF